MFFPLIASRTRGQALWASSRLIGAPENAGAGGGGAAAARGTGSSASAAGSGSAGFARRRRAPPREPQDRPPRPSRAAPRSAVTRSALRDIFTSVTSRTMRGFAPSLMRRFASRVSWMK